MYKYNDLKSMIDDMNYDVLADKMLSIGDPRSEPYRQGLIHILRVRHEKDLGKKAPTGISCPYSIGSAEADAYFSGCTRGHDEWNRLIEANLKSLDQEEGSKVIFEKNNERS